MILMCLEAAMILVYNKLLDLFILCLNFNIFTWILDSTYVLRNGIIG